ALESRPPQDELTPHDEASRDIAEAIKEPLQDEPTAVPSASEPEKEVEPEKDDSDALEPTVLTQLPQEELASPHDEASREIPEETTAPTATDAVTHAEEKVEEGGLLAGI